jgi:RND superfamily putative drug exporter
MRKWSQLIVQHRRIVGFVWLVLFIAGAAAASQVTGRLSTQFDVPGAASYQANLDILRTYGNGAQGYPDAVVITAPAGHTVIEPSVRTGVAESVAAVSALGPFRVASYANTGDTRFISGDAQSEVVLIFLPAYSEADAPPFGPEILQAMRPALPLASRLYLTGLGELIAGGTTHAGADVGALTETVLGGLGALVVLVVVFGSLLAFVPLLIAAVAIVTALLVVFGMTEITSVSFIAEYLIGLIGLGVSIDYSLLMVTRWREERANGRTLDDAIHAAMATAGRSVLFSGVIVAIGLLALVLVPVPFVRSLGYAGLLIPLVSVAATLSLLPVLLGTIGPRMEWPRGRSASGIGRWWTAWARGVVRHRVLGATGALVILVLLGVNALSLQVGEPRADSLATSGGATDGLHAMERAGFPLGILSPIEVLLPDGSATRIASLENGGAGVYTSIAPSGPAWHRRGTAVIDVLPTNESSTAAGAVALTGIRRSLLSADNAAEIGGPALTLVDESAAFYGNFPLVLLLVGLTTFLLLTRVFRSPILALKAVLLNVISIGATYGVVVLVWQEGHGSQLFWGIPATGSIVNWGPLMIFAFLFGLSMDYEVFILTRIREEHDRTGSTTEAIVRGIGRTGRLVTSAALILCLAFISLSASPETDLKIVATGLAAGIVLDATVVRALLVPALISLLGEWNWWLPNWMATALRIPAAQEGRSAPEPHRESVTTP